VRQVHHPPPAVVELVPLGAIEVAAVKPPPIVERLGALVVAQGGHQGAGLPLGRVSAGRQRRQARDNFQSVSAAEAVVFGGGWNSILRGWHMFILSNQA
jgi:hypothetical protein